MELNSEKNSITKGEWKQKEKIPDKEESKLRLLKYLEDYPDLESETYQHKKEQLYLMISWGLDKKEIDFLLNSPITSQDIDFLRLLIFLLDFDFVKEHVIGKNFFYEDIIDQATEKLVREKYPVIYEIEKLKQEKEEAVKEFSLRMEFLKERLESEKSMLELNRRHENELHQKEVELIRNDFAHEKEKWKLETESLEHQVKGLTEKCKAFEEKEQREPEKSAEIPKEPEITQVESPEKKRDLPIEWLRTIKRKRRSHQKDFIVAIMRNTSFQTAQLELLNYAFEIGLPEKNIRDMAVPELPIANMKLLLKFFMNANGIRGEIPDEAESGLENITE